MESLILIAPILSLVGFIIADRRRLKTWAAQNKLIQEQQKEIDKLNTAIGRHQRSLSMYLLLTQLPSGPLKVSSSAHVGQRTNYFLTVQKSIRQVSKIIRSFVWQINNLLICS